MARADNIIDHLTFALRRDAEKGGAGLRSTREIADREGISTAQARRALSALAEKGRVERLDGGDWRLAGQAR